MWLHHFNNLSKLLFDPLVCYCLACGHSNITSQLLFLKLRRQSAYKHKEKLFDVLVKNNYFILLLCQVYIDIHTADMTPGIAYLQNINIITIIFLYCYVYLFTSNLSFTPMSARYYN